MFSGSGFINRMRSRITNPKAVIEFYPVVDGELLRLNVGFGFGKDMAM
jgi:hypothetical protein